MTITITFKDGTVAEFTDCTGYDHSNGVVSFTGTDAAGVVAFWEFNWDEIKSIKRVG